MRFAPWCMPRQDFCILLFAVYFGSVIIIMVKAYFVNTVIVIVITVAIIVIKCS